MGRDIDMDREGIFRGTIREYGSRKTESGAIQLSVFVDIESIWDPQLEQFVSWQEYEYVARGDLNLVKRDGTLNKTQIQALVQHVGWDGDFTSIARETWQPIPCQFVIKEDTYKDQTRYRIEWVNDYNRKPGGFTAMDTAIAKDLQNRLGGELRALVGNVTRSEQKPEGKPPTPVKAPATSAEPPPAEPMGDDDLPF